MGSRLLERFRARSDDGRYETTIVVTQPMIDAGTQDDPMAVIPGMKSVQTADGHPCNYVEEGVFKVLHPLYDDGVIVRRV